MDNPLVSIIIPTYNRAHLIGETLDSVLAQTYTNWECIIVDDGSTDNTDEVVDNYIRRDARFQFHHRPADRLAGGNAARNYGFEMSKGEYVNWFDDDDIMRQNKLGVQVNELVNSNYVFSVCQTLVFENTLDNIIGLRSDKIYSEDVFYDYVTQEVSWLTQAPLWKSSFLDSMEYLFDEELKAAQEWEFHCRVLFNCAKYNIINEPLVYIRQHSQSITYNGDEKNRMWNYYLARRKVNSLFKNYKYEAVFEDYFKKYFMGYFQQLIKDRSLKKALLVYYYSISQYYVFVDKTLLCFYIILRCSFGLGYRFKYYFKL